MEITLSYDEEFTALIERLRKNYGEKIFEIEGIGIKQLDLNANAREFLSSDTTAADVSVDANANVDSRDVIGYQFELPKPLFKLNSLYLLWKQLCKQVGEIEANCLVEAQITGDIYINDFTDIGRPYCFNFSCYDIVLEGLPMITKVRSIAPKSLYSFKSQVEQFIIVAANSTLGATGLADLFICMGLYVQNLYETGRDGNHITIQDGEGYIEEYIKETLTSLIYTLNQPMRGNQSPFTNVSIYDDAFLDELCPHYVLPGGKALDKYYVKIVQRLFLEVMNEELGRTPVTFPVTTACFAVDDGGVVSDEAFKHQIATQNVQWGFINIYCGKTSTLSSCCRLRSDTDVEYFNSFGAGSTKIGSLGVVTLNLPRLAAVLKCMPFKSSVFMMHLIDLANDACAINNAKRAIIKNRVNAGNMPLYTHGHMDISKQYSTIGITGLYEALQILGIDITSPEGTEYANEVLTTLGEICDAASVRYGAPHNMEQVPAESSSVKLADKDKLIYPEYVELHQPYYSNQFIPLTANADLMERIRLQGIFDSKCSGGAICHLNIEERIVDPARIEELIDYCAKSGVIYWAVNYNLQRCSQGHMSVGRGEVCPCGSPIVEDFTRVVGFLTNVKNWNKVRRTQDYPNRVFY